MVAVTYNSLIDSVQAFLERVGDTSLLSYSPLFIDLAQQRIAQEAKILPSLMFVTANFTAGTLGAVIQKPARWRNTVYFNFGVGAEFSEDTAPYDNRRPLLKRDYSYCRVYWPNQTLTEIPKYYADYGSTHWLVVPTPRVAWPMEIAYNELSAPLNAANQTNWCTDYAPNLILYATLLEAAIFIKNETERTKYQQEYDRAATALSGEQKAQLGDASYGPNMGLS